jgi:hypothetical protein
VCVTSCIAPPLSVAFSLSLSRFFLSEPIGSTVLSLTCGPAGNQTTTGSLSATLVPRHLLHEGDFFLSFSREVYRLCLLWTSVTSCAFQAQRFKELFRRRLVLLPVARGMRFMWGFWAVLG